MDNRLKNLASMDLNLKIFDLEKHLLSLYQNKLKDKMDLSYECLSIRNSLMPHPVYLAEEKSIFERIYQRQNDFNKKELGEDHYLNKISDKKLQLSIKRKLNEALSYLQEKDEIHFEFVKLFVSFIIFVECEKFWSSSTIKTFGVIFCAPKKEWNSVHLLETLIHESSHLELSLKQLIDPIIINKKEVSFSPLRGEERSLIAIFHSLYVMVRVIDAFNLFIKIQESSDKNKYKKRKLIKTALEIRNDYLHKSKMAVQNLEKEAQFSEFGKILFSSCTTKLEVNDQSKVVDGFKIK